MILVALAIILATAAGLALERRHGAAADRAGRRLIWTIFNLVVPFIVFANVVGFEFDVGIVLGLVFAYVGMAVAGTTAYLIGSRRLGLSRPSLGAVVNLSFAANTGYLGLPVVAALMGTKALDDAIAFDVLVSAPALLIGAFAVGAGFGRHAVGVKARVRSFFTHNPPLWALALALVMPDSVVPESVVSVSHGLALALAPLGFLAVGITLGHERAFRPTKPVVLSVTCKLVIPVSVLGLLSLLVSGIPTAFFLQAAMACGIYNIAVADIFGLNRSIVAPAVIWSTGLVLAAALTASAIGV